MELRWEEFFESITSEDTPDGLVLAVNDSDSEYYFVTNGTALLFQNKTGLEEYASEHKEDSISYAMMLDAQHGNHTLYTLTVYPSDEFRAMYLTRDPIYFTLGISFIFFLSVTCFLVYGTCVDRRQKDSMDSAVRTNAIVSSLFPDQVKDRLLNEHGKASTDALIGRALEEASSSAKGNTVPIADLFVSAFGLT